MLDKFKFSEIIEMKKRQSDSSYIETITEYCEENDIDLELVPELLTDNLKHNMTKESVALRLVDVAALIEEEDDDVFFEDESSEDEDFDVF